MKLSLAALTSTLLVSSTFFVNVVKADTCQPEPPVFSETVAMMVEKVGSVPTQTNVAFAYNMAVMDNFDGDVIYFLDQQNAKIYSYDHTTGAVNTVFDKDSASTIPDGLSLDWISPGASFDFKVKAMTQGPSSNEVIVVFGSSTLPTGWTTPDGTLPPEGAYGMHMCGGAVNGTVWVPDIYRMESFPYCFKNAGKALLTYDVFYKYSVVDGALTNPEAFFVSESQVSPGHMGGGIVTVDDGKILWSTGDCTIFGIDGHYAPQLNREWCGKIHLIDPSAKGSYTTVAKGVRNSQQMRIFSKSDRNPKLTNAKKFLAFMDIGGVTA